MLKTPPKSSSLQRVVILFALALTVAAAFGATWWRNAHRYETAKVQARAGVVFRDPTTLDRLAAAAGEKASGGHAEDRSKDLSPNGPMPSSVSASPPPSAAPVKETKEPGSVHASSSTAEPADSRAPAARSAEVELRPRTGELRVEAPPGASIYVDGIHKGIAPLPSVLTLSYGTHLVEIRPLQGSSVQRKVTVSASGRHEVRWGD